MFVSSDKGPFLVGMDRGSKDRERVETIIHTYPQNERFPEKKLLSFKCNSKSRAVSRGREEGAGQGKNYLASEIALLA